MFRSSTDDLSFHFLSADTNVLRYIQLTEMKMSKSGQRERDSGKETQG